MPQLGSEKQQQLREQFKKIDKSGDGTLDFKEMSALLRRGNPNMTDAQLRTLFSGVDTNKDGRVDFNEFVVYIYSLSKGGEEAAPPAPEASEDVHAVFQTFANGANMEGTEFAKLCRDSHLLGAALSARDVDMIFAKVVPKGKRAFQYPDFLRALVLISQQKKIDIQELYSQVGDAAPINKGTKADAVRFHDDPSTYTGVASKRHSSQLVPPASLEEQRGRRHSSRGGTDGLLGSRSPSRADSAPQGFGTSRSSSSRPPSRGPAEFYESKGPPASAVDTEEEIPPAPEAVEPDWNELTKVFFEYAGKSDDLDSREFVKLCSDCGLYDKKFTKRDADVLFLKVLFKGDRRIMFGQFTDALKQVAQKKEVAPYFVHRAVLKSPGPIFNATKAEAVRFHDDKSTYTGMHAAN